MIHLLFWMSFPELNKEFLDYLDAASKIIVILGLPIAYLQYRRTKKKERKDREYGTYNSLDEKFLEFQKLCLTHSYLDVFDVADSNPINLNQHQQKEETIIFTMLFSIFERAYLLYSDQGTSIKKKQWIGWDLYIKSFCERKNFLRAWKVSGTTFDSDFEKYMFTHIKASIEKV
jgi:hypothetical protein